MVKQDVNFELSVYSVPALDNVDNGLSIYSKTFGAGANFELAVYAMPLLNAVNFALSIIGSVIEYFGILKRWNGSAWIKAKLKSFNGTFIEKPLKFYDGSQWLLIDTTGI